MGKRRSSKSMPLLQLPWTYSDSSRQLSKHSRFKLPDGWRVEELPRSDLARVDKYYYEPGTGHKFRSLRAVERYINGEEDTPRSRALILYKNFEHPGYSKKIICGGKVMKLSEEEFTLSQLAIVPSTENVMTSTLNLPDGWIIEEVPRRCGCFIDKYYYEPGTGRKFRSHVSVLRHLEELREDIPLSAVFEEIKENKPLSKAFKVNHQGKKSISRKSNIARNSMQTSSFLSPPKKIKWILASPRGDAWNQFIFETPVPDSVQQQWNKKFLSAMSDKNLSTPIAGRPS